MIAFRKRRDSLGVSEFNKACMEYYGVLHQQEIYWQQRAKQFWLRDGDGNTRFFHSLASNRKKRNHSRRLKDDMGTWHYGEGQIQKLASDYFRNLFTASSCIGSPVFDCIQRRVTATQNASLMAPVEVSEVQAAISDMYPDKAPGLDGMNPAFFQSFWPIVGPDVTRLCQNFYSTGIMPNNLIDTTIALIQ